MFNDLIYVFSWWLLFLIIGLAFLPTASKVFSHFLDLGYIFAKILGLAIISYLVWLLASLHLLPFSFLSTWFIFLITAVINVFIIRKSSKEMFEKIRRHWKIIAFEEILFLLALLFLSYVRTHEPSIHGLEKFMDFGFINSLLRTDFFPPKDLWLAPETINYYYFGHLVTAVLTKLSTIRPEITFNLMLATLFGLTFVGAFSLGMNLFNFHLRGGRTDSSEVDKPTSEESWLPLRSSLPPSEVSQNICASKVFGASVVAGLLSAFLVTLAGNLHTIYAFTRGFDKYWYPDATRLIPYTIHEFPSYSWIVSDLHGHVLDIPFVLSTLALLLAFFITKPIKKLILAFIILLSFMLAVMYMTNAWDGIIYLLLTTIIFFSLSFQPNTDHLLPEKISNYNLRFRIFDRSFSFFIFRFSFFVLLVGVGFFLFTLPFTLHFKPFASGLHLVRDHSPLYMLALLWGFFYFFAASFIVFLFKTMKQSNNLTITDVFVLLLIFVSTLLLIFPEIAYVKDIYPLHYRANTMFKLGYQAFIMLSLSSSYIILRIATAKRSLFTYLFILLSLILMAPVVIYPYLGINSYYNDLKNYRGLDGMSWMENQYPSDYQAVLWLRQNVKGQPVVLEAVGESYTDYARVSSFTGLPTVMGWPVHEWLWRGSYDEAGRRDAEVRRAYETNSLSETRSFLKKYQVKYIFIGILERQKYPIANFTKWETLGRPVFQSGQTLIYQIP